MKILAKLSLFVMVFMLLIACSESKNSPESASPKDKNLPMPEKLVDKFSYMMGYEIGFNQRLDSIVLNWDYFMQGYWEAFNKMDAKLSPEEMQEVKDEWMNMLFELRDKKLAETKKKMEIVGEEIKERDLQFVHDMRQKEGYITRPSGLVYKIIDQGTGKVPKQQDFVRMNVIAKLVDGKLIDNTYESQPRELPVEAVFAGWQEALMMMPEGSKWEVIVPPHLAYRDAGFGDLIPPHSAVILELQLLKVLEGEELEAARKNFIMMMDPARARQGMPRPGGN